MTEIRRGFFKKQSMESTTTSPLVNASFQKSYKLACICTILLSGHPVSSSYQYYYGNTWKLLTTRQSNDFHCIIAEGEIKPIQKACRENKNIYWPNWETNRQNRPMMWPIGVPGWGYLWKIKIMVRPLGINWIWIHHLNPLDSGFPTHY